MLATSSFNQKGILQEWPWSAKAGVFASMFD